MKMKNREQGTGWGRLVLALVAAVAMATGAWADAAAQFIAYNTRVEQRFPWNDYVDVRFSIKTHSTIAKNTNIIARVRGFYDGQMMLDMDHLYLAKADGSPDLSRQFIGGDVFLKVDESGVFHQDGLKPNEVRLVWDAAKDVPPEAEKIKTLHVTVELEPMTKDVEISCHNGIMVGEAHGIGDGSNVTAKIVSFLGVPFAHPPTNDFDSAGNVTHIRRWKAPEWAPTNWEARIQAKRFAPSPLQQVTSDETSSSTHCSEDCLYLNLWTGYTDDVQPINNDANKPVLVFIHGGAFCQGGTKEYINDCRYLAEKYGNEVIFVTLEYRLGLLAEFDFTDLFKDDADKEKWKAEYPDHGRLFIKDLQMGLRWLKANVKNFGGDPTRITVSGESAGSISTFYLMAKYNHDENGNQLFQRAIPMSGAEISNSRADYTNAHHGAALCAALALTQGKSPYAWKSMTLDDLQKATEQELVAALMCPLEKVREVGVDARALLLSENKIVFDLFVRPLAEGREGEPSSRYAACGTNVYDAVATTPHAVDLLTGTVGNEARYWANCFYQLPSAERPLDFFYQNYLPMTFAMCIGALPAKEGEDLAFFVGGCASKDSPFHEADDDNPNLNFGFNDIWGKTEILGELQFRLPQIRLAENYSTNAAARAANKRCYMYLFEKGQVLPDKPWARSMHASELPYLFNHPYYTDYGPLNKGLMDRFSEMIIEFVKTGVPKYRANDGDQKPMAVPAEYRVENQMQGMTVPPRSTIIIRDLEANADPGRGNCKIEEVSDPLGERRRLLMPVSVALPPGMF